MSSRSDRDEAWHEAIYLQYRARVMSMLIFILKGDYQGAEEIYQDTLLTAWNKRYDDLPDPPKLEAWIRETAKNHARNYVKRRSNRHHEHLDEMLSERYVTGSADVEVGYGWEIEELAGFSVIDRQILILTKGFMYSCSEAAEVLGIEKATARQRLKRALERLKRKRNGGDDDAVGRKAEGP